MRKIILIGAALLYTLTGRAQDTTCSYFLGNSVLHFDYQTSEPISDFIEFKKNYTIEVKDGEVLCLDLSNDPRRVRKVLLVFQNGETEKHILDSADDVYYVLGPVRVVVGKPRVFIAL
jgi:hypothetical protein